METGTECDWRVILVESEHMERVTVFVSAWVACLWCDKRDFSVLDISFTGAFPKWMEIKPDIGWRTLSFQFPFFAKSKNSHLINSLRKCISCYPGVTMCLFNRTMSLCKYVNMLMLHNSRYVRIYLRMNGRLAIWTSLLSCLLLWILWVFWADLWLLSSFLVTLFYP